MSSRFAFLILAVFVVGCGKPSPGDNGETDQAAAKPSFDPCESVRQLDPHCGWTPHWDHLSGPTNAIDGTKTEFLSLDSTDADGTSTGRLSYAELKICLENKKLCGNNSVAIGVNVHGMVAPVGYESLSQYRTSVRTKFDDDKPSRQTWGIADSHDMLFPHGSENQFLLQLIRHKKLVLEFSYYEKAPRTLTFDLSGLDDNLKSLGIGIKAQVAAREALERSMESTDREQKNAAIEAFVGAHTEVGKNIASQIALCKNKNFPNEYCWEPADKSGPWGPFPTIAVATKYAMEHYQDHTK
jgi:hypothetical protein